MVRWFAVLRAWVTTAAVHLGSLAVRTGWVLVLVVVLVSKGVMMRLVVKRRIVLRTVVVIILRGGVGVVAAGGGVVHGVLVIWLVAAVAPVVRPREMLPAVEVVVLVRHVVGRVLGVVAVAFRSWACAVAVPTIAFAVGWPCSLQCSAAARGRRGVALLRDAVLGVEVLVVGVVVGDHVRGSLKVQWCDGRLVVRAWRSAHTTHCEQRGGSGVKKRRVV